MNDSKAVAASPSATTVWKQRYEALRQLATGGRQILESDPLGWVLLLRQGVAGWMRSWSELTVAMPPPPAPVWPPTAGASGWQTQLTQLLAEISLAHLSTKSLS